jgi:hypothetical protein
MSDRYVAEVLDEACRAWSDLIAHHSAPRELRVNPAVYDSIASAKAKEVARGNPLLILGLPLVASATVPPARAELA